jgi:NDP-sugar pyrophosphorylase family protein
MLGTTDVIGIGLAGGQGVRARPLTLKAPGYLRSKAAMSFLGRRLIRWVMQILSAEGIKSYHMVTHGKENRYQIKVLIGYGEEFGVDIRYSPVKYDPVSTGSADSTLRMLDYWDLYDTALVFPTDSLIDFDLAPMVEFHHEQGAIVTVAGMSRAPSEVAEKYGVMLNDARGRVVSFVEKPSLAELREHFGTQDEREFTNLPLLTNAGFYLIDVTALRKLAEHQDIARLRQTRLDFGKDLLPWLVGNGYPVYAAPVRRTGDLGNLEDYLETMVEVLHGRFESLVRLMGPAFDPEHLLWIAPESLYMRDSDSGMTLAEKMSEGLVTIGPGVRIGRYCEIGPGAMIVESNLDDDVEVRGGAYIARSEVRDGAMIGHHATICNSYVGSMSEVRSELGNETIVEEYVGLGDEVIVYPGVRLSGHVSVYPRLKIPPGMGIPEGTEVTGPADVLRFL